MFYPIIKLGVGFLRVIADCGWGYCGIFLFELKFVMGFKNTVPVLQYFLACEYNRFSFVPATTCERTERQLFAVKVFPVKL